MADLSFFVDEPKSKPIAQTDDGKFDVYQTLLAFGVVDNLPQAAILLDQMLIDHPDIKVVANNQSPHPVADEVAIMKIWDICGQIDIAC